MSAAAGEIGFFNRYTDQIETEKVYGDGFLRFTYGNPLGRLALHAVVKRACFSRWYGWRMDRPASRSKVGPFIRDFAVDESEFAEPTSYFRTFNEFFYRRLKASARPINPDPLTAVFPADGRHLGFPDISKMDGIFVKGKMFDLAELLGDGLLSRRYARGTMILSRLCPVDYHRFHFPVAGVAGESGLINGPLYSVNPIALKQNIRIFAENKRAVCRIKSPRFGTVLMLEIGATCVGGFAYTYSAGSNVSKGQEKGYFKFGGSSTITLFEPGRIELDQDLVDNSRQHRELYARMGDRMGITRR
jgi:phosphatidylserine decarboxylase